jgi:hypothetical protein
MAKIEFYYSPDVVWWFSIVNKINENSELKDRYSKWAKHNVGLVFSVLSKIEILRIIERDLEKDISDLSMYLEPLKEHLQAALSQKKAFPINREMAYNLVYVIDAFFYEYRSLYEILGKLISGFLSEVLDRGISEDELISELTFLGVGKSWISTLKGFRIRFFHNESFHLGIEQIDERLELIIIPDVSSDEDDIVKMDQLREIFRGMNHLLRMIEDYILDKLHD